MPLDRRTLVLAGSALAVSASIPYQTQAAKTEAKIGDNGLHVQDWFLESFLELGDDYTSAKDAGKGLIVLFEQRGCPYCSELHNVNFARKEINQYITTKFDTVQLDIWGSREVIDFDGKAMEERKLASRWGVNFTPTAVFFAADAEPFAGKTGREAQSARMPGYFKPFHFMSMLEFVGEGHYKTLAFQRFISDKINALQEKGIKPSVW